MKHTTNAGPWTDAENAALIALYFTMLDHATAGEAYNKAAMIRAAQGEQTSNQRGGAFTPLSNRSRGSIEAKLMNASAAHRDLGGTPTMDGYGYRALSNYQKTLKDAMAAALANEAADGRAARLAADNTRVRNA